MWAVPYWSYPHAYDPPAQAFGQALAQSRKYNPVVAGCSHNRLILRAFAEWVGSFGQQKRPPKAAFPVEGILSLVLGGGLIAAAPHFLLQECPAQPNPGAGPRRQEHPSRIIASGIP